MNTPKFYTDFNAADYRQCNIGSTQLIDRGSIQRQYGFDIGTASYIESAVNANSRYALAQSTKLKPVHRDPIILMEAICDMVRRYMQSPMPLTSWILCGEDEFGLSQVFSLVYMNGQSLQPTGVHLLASIETKFYHVFYLPKAEIK